MEILVLQHVNIETPGFIKDLMLKDGIKLKTIELDEGEQIPDDISSFDAMFCMGGPMDTWMEKEHPWLIDEKRRIKEFVVDLQKPFLGFCLGCQLLGEILGGSVVKSSPPEIGMLDIHLTNKTKLDKVFSSYPDTFKALQWHSYEVQGLETNADVSLLGSSPSTKYQLFKYKNHAYGIQFHIEIKENTVDSWACVPEYKSALESSLGKNSLEKFQNQASQNMKNMNLYATILYNEFFDLIQNHK